jgi:adenine specific DNA methylase Mod
MRPKETREYSHEDRLGKYRLTIIEKKHAGAYKRDSMRFPILGIYPRSGKRWQIGQSKAQELERKKRFILDKGVVKLKIYDFEDKDTFSAQPNLLDEHGTTDSAQKMLTEIFGKPEIFDNPKPVELIKHLILITCEKDDIVLDSFAGSGTTAHAVMELNKQDGNRKFILVEMESIICRNITSERVRRIAKGYTYKKAKGENIKVAGLGGGFEYARLGEPLFNADGSINEKVSFENMARYIYFTETHTNLEKKTIKANYLGIAGDTHYFLFFDGIGKNVLDKKSLKEVISNKGKKVVYADKCLIDEDVLEEQQIIFKQIPYSVKVY